MERSREPAQAIVAQLRNDLKRFARGRSIDLELLIGRRPRYLRRVAADNLKLSEALAAIRFLGFLPSEYLERVQRTSTMIPQGIPGFFRIRAPRTPDLSGLTKHSGFFDWCRAVRIEDTAPQVRFDIDAQLKPLGLEIGSLDILNEADSLFPIFERHQPAAISRQTAQGMVASLSVISRALICEGHLVAGCKILDIGFDLERSLKNLKARHELFRIGSVLCERLGLFKDLEWCLGEAISLGALVPDLSAVLEDQKWLNSLNRFRRSSHRTGFLEAGKRDSIEILQSLRIARSNCPLSAAELDQILGAKNAFSNAVGNRREISLGRLSKLLKALNLAPDDAFKLAGLAPAPVRTVSFMKGLKEKGGQPLFPFQAKLLTWANNLNVDESAGLLDFPSIPMATPPEEVFQEVIEEIERIANLAPITLRKDEAQKVVRELVRAAYVLRTRGHRNDSADFLDAAIQIQGILGDHSTYPLIYRNAGYLAVELGAITEARIFGFRSLRYALMDLDVKSTMHSLFFLGYTAFVMGEYSTAIEYHRACWQFPEQERAIEPFVVSRMLAVSFLRSNDFSAAKHWLEQSEPELLTKGSDRWKGEFLRVKAELFSKTGRCAEALVLIEEALRLLEPLGDPVGLAVARLQRLSIHLHMGDRVAALTEAASLMNLAGRIQNNPIGRMALEELARCLSRPSLLLDQQQLLIAEQKLLYPLLSTQT